MGPVVPWVRNGFDPYKPSADFVNTIVLFFARVTLSISVLFAVKGVLPSIRPFNNNNNNNNNIASVGLRLSDEAVRVAVAHRLGCKACVPHTCAVSYTHLTLPTNREV